MKFSTEDVELFNDSLERCTEHPQFLARFYEIFLASSPDVADKFKHTNFNRQRRMLKSSLYLLIFASEGKPEGLSHLDRMAEVHGKGHLDIPEFMYELWMESLLKAVREFDVAFSPRVEQAWRNMLLEGIEHMKNHSAKEESTP